MTDSPEQPVKPLSKVMDDVNMTPEEVAAYTFDPEELRSEDLSDSTRYVLAILGLSPDIVREDLLGETTDTSVDTELESVDSATTEDGTVEEEPLSVGERAAIIRANRNRRADRARSQRRHWTPEDEANRDSLIRNLKNEGIFQGGLTLPVDSKDQWAVDRFGIPTYTSTQKPPDELRPLSRFEQTVRGIGARWYLNQENIKNSNAEGSRENKQAVEYVNDLQSTGNDAEVRNLFRRMVGGRVINIYTGKEDSQADYLDALRYWGRDPARMQAAIWYEFTKVKSEKEFKQLLEFSFELINAVGGNTNSDLKRTFTREGIRFSEESIIGMWKGLGFMHKQMHLTFKHLDFGTENDKNKDNFGLFVVNGVNVVEFVTELTTKFRGYEISGFSPIDAANIAQYAERALAVSIEFQDRPNSPEFRQSQYILQRLHMQINDLRFNTLPSSGMLSAAENAGENRGEMEFLQAMAAQRESVKQGLSTSHGSSVEIVDEIEIDQRTGQPVKTGVKFEYNPNSQQPRTGGAATTGESYVKTAAYTDVAVELFPNLKFYDDREMQSIEDKAAAAVDEDTFFELAMAQMGYRRGDEHGNELPAAPEKSSAQKRRDERSRERARIKHEKNRRRRQRR